MKTLKIYTVILYVQSPKPDSETTPLTLQIIANSEYAAINKAERTVPESFAISSSRTGLSKGVEI